MIHALGTMARQRTCGRPLRRVSPHLAGVAVLATAVLTNAGCSDGGAADRGIRPRPGVVLFGPPLTSTSVAAVRSAYRRGETVSWVSHFKSQSGRGGFTIFIFGPGGSAVHRVRGFSKDTRDTGWDDEIVAGRRSHDRGLLRGFGVRLGLLQWVANPWVEVEYQDNDTGRTLAAGRFQFIGRDRAR